MCCCIVFILNETKGCLVLAVISRMTNTPVLCERKPYSVCLTAFTCVCFFDRSDDDDNNVDLSAAPCAARICSFETARARI